MDLQLNIPVASTECTIAVRNGLIGDLGRHVRRMVGDGGSPVTVIVTDRNVQRLYGHAVHSSLQNAGFDCLMVSVQPGEPSKSLDSLSDLFRAMAGGNVGRDGTMLALGGGVVSDLAGFAAATWMRGIRFAICPTTLEAQIDAAIGGKTAVNFPGGKNLIGVFHQPSLVLIDPVCLRTLGMRELRAGLAESVKHALIASEAFFEWHTEHVGAVLRRDEHVTADLIERNVAIKARIVQEDAREQSDRRILLNFGHTIGHAIEEAFGYALRHGECVALGMLAACRLSHDLGMLGATDVGRVRTLLEATELPTGLEEPMPFDQIRAVMANDKKTRGRKTRFVLLEGIGHPVVRNDVPEDAIRRAYGSLRDQ